MSPPESRRDWPNVLRRYLALRAAEDLQRVLIACPRSLSSFLEAYRANKRKEVEESLQVLLTEPVGQDQGVTLTLKLIALDLVAVLVNGKPREGIEVQKAAIQEGVNACRAAIRIAEEVNDLGCGAAYWFLLGNGIQALGDVRSAVPLYERSISMVKKVVSSGQEEYRILLLKALNNLGSALAIFDLDSAYDAYIMAVDTCESLADEEPQKCNMLAMTLNNFARVLGYQQRHLEAGNAYREAVKLYRDLARTGSFDAQSALATTLNNFGTTLIELRGFKAAERVLNEAREIGARLITGGHNAYRFTYGSTLNNLGIALRELRQTEAATQAYRDALVSYRILADHFPERYQSNVATALNNLGNVLSDRGDLAAAGPAYIEAVKIRRKLAAEDPTAYRADLAMALNNIGTFFKAERNFESAQIAHEEALAIRRELASVRPKLYRPAIAVTLNNLGTVLRVQGKFDDAFAAFREALVIYEADKNWLYAGLTYWNLVLLSDDLRNEARTLEYAQMAVISVEKGLNVLATLEAQNRDRWKAEIEGAYKRLIAHNAISEKAGEKRSVVRFCEALRRIELLAESGNNQFLNDTFEDEVVAIEGGVGPAAQRLISSNGAFIWVHSTNSTVVYVILRPGQPLTVLSGDKSWVSAMEAINDRLRWLFAGEHNCWETPERIGSDNLLGEALLDLGLHAYDSLPFPVRELLSSGEYSTIFLSPCGETISFIWEMLVCRKSNRFVGLTKLFVRTHGLTETISTCSRSPASSRVVLHGDPRHNLGVELPSALAVTTLLSAELESTHWQVESLYRADATLDKSIEKLSREDLGVWIFNGHGNKGTLLLAGSDTLGWADILSLRWRTQPFIHFDCCQAGADWAVGGGRFGGMPAALLAAGASAVLSSFHPLYDDEAAELSKHIYELVLRERRPLGEAILTARNWVHERYGGDPLSWATSQLWGNPMVHLGPVVDQKDQLGFPH